MCYNMGGNLGIECSIPFCGWGVYLLMFCNQGFWRSEPTCSFTCLRSERICNFICQNSREHSMKLEKFWMCMKLGGFIPPKISWFWKNWICMKSGGFRRFQTFWFHTNSEFFQLHSVGNAESFSYRFWICMKSDQEMLISWSMGLQVSRAWVLSELLHGYWACRIL